MNNFLDVFNNFLNLKFVLFVLIGSIAGLFVGAIPGLSVTMATALLVSITYTWAPSYALAAIIGVYVIGVFSGAVSAILINIPGAPSSVVTTIDGYPLAQKGEVRKALFTATIYSFVGSLFGIIALWLLAKPISNFALKFTPMDYFLLAFFGLSTVGSLTAKDFYKGIISALLGILLSMIGMDSVYGIPRLSFGIDALNSGINIVPVLVGLFGFAEILFVVSCGMDQAKVIKADSKKVSIKEILKHFFVSLYYCSIGTFVGALPGAGTPVASFLAYSEAKRITKKPSRAFGTGAIEGIVASEAANNACVGGALIPLLTLAVPGDAVTSIMLSVFNIHGLRLGPLFIKTSPDIFNSIISACILSTFFILLLGFFVTPFFGKILNIKKKHLLPVVTLLCIIGAFACNNRLFDVFLMLLFGFFGFVMRKKDYPLAPMTLGLVLGNMMDSNFRRAISLASSDDNVLLSLFGRPLTIVLASLSLIVIINGIIHSAKKRK